MSKKRVVITGLGVISSIGIGKNDFWTSLINGKSGIDKIKSFDATTYDTQIAAEVPNFDPLVYMPPPVAKRTDRFAQFGIAATKLAVYDAGLDLEKENRERIGVNVGAGLGGMFFYEQQIVAIYEGGVSKAHPLGIPRITPNAAAGQISIELGLKGPSITISTACSSGMHAVGSAFNTIQLGKADVMIAGGTEAPLMRFNFAAFNALSVMSRRNDAPQKASRPFDKDRDGFVMGEGAAILILEDLEHANKRNATIYAEIVGYAATSGGYHMVIPSPEGEDAVRAMVLALEDATIKPYEISYISAHGTSTQANDLTETIAIKKVFGKKAYATPISAIKSMVGHTLGAAGALELTASSLAIKNGIIPPTINYETPDPNCDLDYTPNVARQRPLDYVLANSFGFGSNNASIVLKKFKA